jgi:uncharacterized protein (DUF2141 family)
VFSLTEDSRNRYAREIEYATQRAPDQVRMIDERHPLPPRGTTPEHESGNRAGLPRGLQRTFPGGRNLSSASPYIPQEKMMSPRRVLARMILAAAVLAGPASAGDQSDLTVRAHGMRNSDGQVLCALFNGPDGFPDGESAVQGDRTRVSRGKATCEFKNLKPGVYAAAVFHDEDGDGQMDSVLGIPTEGFAFSNNAKPGMFGPPSFKEAAFRVSGGKRALLIKMLYM